MTEDDILAQAEKLCRKPSGYEIECKDGMYILHPDTYDILAKRANLLTELLAEAKLWKAKAIGDRARLIYCDSEDVEDHTWWSQEDDEYKKPFRERATRELEEEMKHV